MMGSFSLIERRPWKWVLCPLLAGAIYFLVCAKWLLPYFAAGKINFFSLYAPLGKDLFSLFTTFLTHPGQMLSLLTSPDRLEYLVMLFMPLGLVPLLGARALLPILLIFLQHMLSNRLTERSFEFHYTAEILPFIFLALIFALRALLPLRKILAGVVAILFICSSLAFVQGPYEKITHIFSELKEASRISLKEDFFKRIPSDAPLVATFDFLSKASNREELYSFHHIYRGYYTLSQKIYPLPVSVNYALLDMMDKITFNSFYHSEGYLNTQRFLNTFHLVPVAARDNLILFSLDANSKIDLFSRSTEAFLKNDPLFTDGEVRLNKVDALIKDTVLYLNFDWSAELKPKKDVNIYVDFLDQRGVSIRKLPLAVCYRIFPTQAWPAGERVLDKKYLMIPSELAGHDFLVKIGFFDQSTGRILGKEIFLPVRKEN
jgi:hypothetical protein